MEPGTDNSLKLRARDAEDLIVVSAMLQDAIVPLGDIAFLPDENSFVLALNRYRWEQPENVTRPERIHAGVRFDDVHRVRYSGIDMKNRSGFLSLLSLEHQPHGKNRDSIILYFSGGGKISLEIELISCLLSDFGTPWPTQYRPDHGEPGVDGSPDVDENNN
jgi:hypothetical protein